MLWKMRQSAVRVRNHNHGTTVALYRAQSPWLDTCVKRLMQPLKYRVPPDCSSRIVTFFRECDLLVFAGEFELKLKRATELLPAPHADEQKHILPQRGRYGHLSMLLCLRHEISS